MQPTSLNSQIHVHTQECSCKSADVLTLLSTRTHAYSHHDVQKASLLIRPLPHIPPSFQSLGCQARCHGVSFGANPPSSPLPPIDYFWSHSVENAQNAGMEREKGDVNALKTPPKPGSVYLHAIYSLKGTCECVIEILWDSVCVCVWATVRVALWVGCKNYLADVTWGFSHKHTHTTEETEELAPFSSSLLPANLNPETGSGHSARPGGSFFVF